MRSQYKYIYFPSHPRSVIFVRMKKFCILGCQKRTKGRFWLECWNAQADLNFRWPYMSEGKDYCSWCKWRVAAVQTLPVLHHSADYIFISFETLGPIWYLWKWSSAHVYMYANRCRQCCKLHYCLWRVSIKPRLPFFFFATCSLFPRKIFILLLFYYTAAGEGRWPP